MTPTDAAFLKAITTIKAISRGPNALGKPPPRRKVQLYSLYKQATEGDVEGIMPRPEGNDPQSKANQLKWDAWKSQQGKSKQEAKIQYVGCLLDTMRQLAPSADPSDLPPQWLELEELYESAKRSASESGAERANNFQQAGYPGASTSAAHSRRMSVGSVASSYSHFLRSNPVPSPSLRQGSYSEFGLSEKDRSELQADQLVDRLQSVYPPVIPGAVPPVIPYDNSMWPAQTPPPGKAFSAAGEKGDDDDAPHQLNLLNEILRRVYNKAHSIIISLFRRVVVDSVVIVSALVLLRVVASRPSILQKSPILRRVFNTIIRIAVVILDGFGIELRLKRPGTGGNRSLQNSRA